MRHPTLAHADFRREYGIGRDEVPELYAVEFVELLAGLSEQSRFHGALAEKAQAQNPAPATLAPMRSPRKTYDTHSDYVRALKTHRGRVVELPGGGA